MAEPPGGDGGVPGSGGRAASWLSKVAGSAKRAAGVLRDEYAKGKSGDDAPVQMLGPSAAERLHGLLARFRAGSAADPAAGDPGHESDAPDDAAEVSGLLRGVDWHRVSTSISDSAAAQRMKDLAGQVDWSRAKPVAARVGTALIAAAASGQLGGLQGRTGAMVARTILDQSGLAERVAARLASDPEPVAQPIQAYIDTTATEMVPTDGGFDARLSALRRALGPGDAHAG